MLLLIEQKTQDQLNETIWMLICTWWRGPIPKNKKGIILRGMWTYDIFASHVITNISYVCKPCNPCWSVCKHIVVCKPCACKHIKCLQAIMWTCLGTHAKAHLGKHWICNFLCRRIGTLEWWNDTFVWLQFWLEKVGAFLSSLHLSWAWGLAIFFGECVSLISAEYHLVIFPSTLTLTLADHHPHP